MAQQSQVQLLDPMQLAGMTASDRSNYLTSLQQSDPNTAAALANEVAKAKSQLVAGFMANAQRKRAMCPPAGGGTSSTYATGSSLTFNLPVVKNGLATDVELTVDIKFTPATGTSATYAWSAAGAYAWFSEIDIIIGGLQARIRPYFLKVLDTIRRSQNLPYYQVVSGLNSDSTINGIVATAQPTLTAGSAATSKFKLRIPLNALHFSTLPGVLPIMGNLTQAQVVVQCATTLGASNCDPMQVPINYSGGSGNGITLDSTEKTISAEVIYVDGTTLTSARNLDLPDLVGEPTCQYYIDSISAQLTSGNIQRTLISTQLKHFVVASVVIDGGSSTVFASPSNIAAIELDQDTAGSNKFYQYGTATNTTFYDYAADIRRVLGQDLDDGVILWAYGQGFNQENLDNRQGNAYLNMMSGGWPSATTAVQITTATSTYFTPRVETYLLSLNPKGVVTG